MLTISCALSALPFALGCNVELVRVGGNDAGASTGSDAGAVRACTPGADQTCNGDPSVSALWGTCKPDGTCACRAGFHIPPEVDLAGSVSLGTARGRCMPGADDLSSPFDAGAPVGCTPPYHQTCNADMSMSAIAGTCKADGTCACNAGYAMRRSGKCGGAATAYPEVVAGTWLIGWSGGLDHFSWVRLQGWDSGRADFLATPSPRASTTPYLRCSGQGSWAITQKMNSIALYLPAACAPESVMPFTFQTFSAGPPLGFVGAELEVAFEHMTGQQPILGFRFPDSQCNAAFTACTDPFLP